MTIEKQNSKEIYKGVTILKKEFFSIATIGLVFFLTTGMAGCSSSSDDAKKIQAPQPAPVQGSVPVPDATKTLPGVAPAAPTAAPQATAPLTPLTPSTIVVQVNDAKLTKAQVDAMAKQKLAEIGGQVPPDRLPQFKAEMKRQIVDFFVVNTLLTEEIKKRKIRVSDKEIKEATNNLKSSLPPGTSLEEMLKKNKMTKKDLRQKIETGLSVRKLVAMQLAGKGTPSDKEIDEFYKKNPDKFKIPELVHARHILVTVDKTDDAAAKAKKKEKAEGIRKQLVAGGDFAQIAKTSSDCPSKNNGRDLGEFPRGQMVKPFDDAAFSQKKGEIGPVVETDFGYHVIQVLDHQQPKTQPLDKETKLRVSAFLAQKKERDAYTALVEQLRTKAKIYIADRME